MAAAMALAPWVLEQVGRVLSVGQFEVRGVEVGGGQMPEGLLCRLPTGGVGVCGDADAVAAVDHVDVGAQQLDLGDGERGSHRGDAGRSAVATQGDGQCVHGTFDDHRECAAREEFAGFAVPEQRLTLGEDPGGAGVEVFRSGVAVVGLGGVTTSEEAEDHFSGGVVGVADGHDEPVAEEVAVVGRAVVEFPQGDEAGLVELVEGGALLGEVADQAATAAGRKAGRVVGVVGEVGS